MLGVVGGELGEAGGKVFRQHIPDHPECLKVGDPLRAQSPRARVVGDALLRDPTPESIAARSAIALWHPHITVLGVVGGECGQTNGKLLCQIIPDHPERFKIGDPLRAQSPWARVVDGTLCADPLPESMAARSAIAFWHPHMTVLGAIGGERGKTNGKLLRLLIPDHPERLEGGDPLGGEALLTSIALNPLSGKPAAQRISRLHVINDYSTVSFALHKACIVREAVREEGVEFVPYHPECFKIGDPLGCDVPWACVVGDALLRDPTPESIAARSAIACWHPHITVLGVVGGERGEADGKSIVGVVDD